MKIFTSNLRVKSLLLALLCTQNLTAQNPQWMNFTNGDMIFDLAENGNVLWAGTYGGLVKYDKVTAGTVFYNKANSGLPRNEVGPIAIESNGDIWIITDAGLSNYDGNNWRIYDTTNSNMPNQYLHDIAIDQNGLKWIASTFGLISFDGTNWSIYDTANSNITGQGISRVFISPTNEKWTCSNLGIERFDGTNWTFYDYTVAPYSFYNTTDLAFNGNDVYVCTHGDFGQGEGLVHFDGNIWSAYNPSNSGLPFSRTECLDVDTAGNLWIGNIDSWGGPAALVQFDGVNWTADTTGIPGLINNLEIDNANRFFAGTESYGLSSYDGANFTKINTSNSGLNSGGGMELCIDDVQDVWTVNGGGFIHFDRQTWNIFDSSNSSFLNSGIICIARDHIGGTWVGTNEGVVRFDGTNWTRWDTSNSQLTSQYINAITVDPDNAAWVGTQFAPFKFDGVDWINYFANAGSNINDVYVTDDGDVWMGSPGYGLNRFDRINTWTNYTPPMGGNFQAGTLDKNGNVWYGGSYLNRWDGNSWTYFSSANGLPWDFITALAVDTNNILWIGTQNGLSSYDGNTFTNYFLRNSGLTADYISDIDVDSFNNKWICTSNGISVYNENGVVMSVGDPMNHNQEIDIYPNPASTVLNIRCADFNESIQFTLTDVLGNEVYSTKLSSNLSKIDISGLSSGVYLGSIYSKDFVRRTGKVVIR